MFVDLDAVVDGEARSLGQLGVGGDAHTDHHQLGIDLGAIGEQNTRGALAVIGDLGDLHTETQVHTVRVVHVGVDLGQLATEYAQ